MTRIRWAIALSLTAMAAPAALLVPAAPVSAQPGTGVNGRNARLVVFPAGYYAYQPDGSWAEYNRQGKVTFRFRETNRDDWSVYLEDPSRNVQIQLDLFRRKVVYRESGGPPTDLYNIIDSDGPNKQPQPQQPPPPRYVAPPAPPPPSPAWRGPVTRPVNAGPIWNQADAQVKCPVVAHAVGGRWTGGWWTVRNGEMSVCEIAQ